MLDSVDNILVKILVYLAILTYKEYLFLEDNLEENLSVLFFFVIIFSCPQFLPEIGGTWKGITIYIKSLKLY